MTDAELSQAVQHARGWLTAVENELAARASQENAKLDSPKEQKTFYVLNSHHHIYTSIVADNKHHAGNKATNLFRGKFDYVLDEHTIEQGWAFVTVSQFNKLVGNRK